MMMKDLLHPAQSMHDPRIIVDRGPHLRSMSRCSHPSCDGHIDQGIISGQDLSKQCARMPFCLGIYGYAVNGHRDKPQGLLFFLCEPSPGGL